MTWATIKEAFTSLSGILSLLRWLASFIEGAKNRQAGEDAAIVAGQKQEDAALIGTQTAIDDADKKPIEYRD